MGGERERSGPERTAVVVGGLRMASGISFLVAPEAANRIWGGNPDDVGPTASLLLRSMGYRDALVGGLLLRSGLRRDGRVAGWFLASAGADLADLAGGIANHDRMSDEARRKGIGGAAVGIAVGVLGAAAARRARPATA
ncbi:MAG TPA: DUF4267 domain-containing protein [Acidimicrobiales bacterium]|nr:DUF4267 domain-containing protein [Acidimicrobiales bacterium]